MQNIDILDFLGFCIQFHSKLRIPNDQDSVNTSTPDYLHQYTIYLSIILHQMVKFQKKGKFRTISL